MSEVPPASPGASTRGRFRAIAVTGAVLFILAVLINVFVWRFLSHRVYALRGQEPPRSAVAVAGLPPEPLLQGSALHRALLDQDLAEMHQRDEQILSQYVWVSPQAKIVRIPIERAIDLLVQRGLPVRSAAVPATTQSAAPPASAPANPH